GSEADQLNQETLNLVVGGGSTPPSETESVGESSISVSSPLEFGPAGDGAEPGTGGIRTYSNSEIIVSLANGYSLDAFSAFSADSSGWIQHINLGGSKTILSSVQGTLVELALSDGNPYDLIVELQALDFVSWAAPNYLYDFDPSELIPNDPLFGSQYHHTLMGNTTAWNTTTGSPNIIVAIADDGIDLDHVDLQAGIWTNAGEIIGNGIDDDGNGFVDDVHGWDFSDSDNDANPAVGDSHGTHVAGIVGARINNATGVTGTAPGVTLMPIRMYGGAAGFTSSVLAQTFAYAADNGAHIFNLSYNIDGFASDPTFNAGAQYLYDAGVLYFNSAGNNGQQDPPRQSIQQALMVANTTSADIRSSSSNYGYEIDISAPGTSILSTYPDDTYASISGTSMATPNAAAVAALIWSANPTWTRDQVAAQLIATADNIDGINPLYAGELGSGRVNSARALSETIAAPQIEGLNDLPSHLGTFYGASVTGWSVDLANVFDPASVNNLANWELRSDGANNIFGDGDDDIIPISLDNPYLIGTNRLFFSTTAPLAAETYRFRAISGGLEDPFGNDLDGNGDGTGGDHFDHIFTISDVSTEVELSGGHLEIRDVATFGKNDHLTIDFDTGSGEIVISDAGAVIRLIGLGTQVSDHEVRIAAAGLTGDLTVALGAGVDALTIDGLSSLTGELAIDSELTLLGAATMSTTGNQTYGGDVILMTDVILSGANVWIEGDVNSQGGDRSPIVNGGFETGDFSGWTVSTFVDINEGTLNPAGPALAQAPISGNFDATTNSTGAGIQSLGQTIAVPTGFTSAVLSWSDRIQNFSSGGFLDPSQEIRVRLLTATGEQIGELFSTNPGDAAIQLGPNARSADLTSLLQGYDGQSVVIQFENQNTANYQNLTLDDVSLLFVAPPQVTHSLLVETNGAGSTKFKGSVGNRSALSGLATNADGVTEIGGDVTIVDGAVAFGDAVILTSDLTVSTSGIGGTVTFADTVDAAPGSEAGLSVFTSGGGAVSLLGDAGTVRRLRSLAIDASGDVLTDGDIIALTDIGLSGADIAINGDLQAGIGDISVDASGSVTIGPDSSISGLAQPLDLLSQDFESFGQGSTVSGANVVLTEGWTNIINGSGDDLDWTPDKGGTPSRAGGTGPLVDHTLGTSLGTYLYVESSGTAAPAKVARLISPTFDLSNLSSGQAEFYYHLFGSAMGSLAVQASADGGVTWSGNLFTISGNQGDVWRQATVDLSDFLGSSDVRLRFEGTTGTSFLSDMAIDDLAITGLTRDDATDVTISAGSTVTIAGDIKGADIEIRAAGDVSVLASGSVTQASDLPDSPETDLLTQDFEGFGQKSTVSGATVTLVEGWINDSGDDLDWTSDLGGTPSRGGGTGPLTDHTLGTAAGTYLYVESSSSGVGFPNKVANLISPSIDLSGTVNNQVEFYHHLFGAAMGSLTVQVSTDGGATWSSDLYSVSGNQGDVWNKAQIDLSAFDGQSDVRLRLHAVTGTNFTSDIAVDDFRVFGDRILDELHIESETGSVTIAGEIAGDSEIHIEAAGDVQFTSSSIVSNVGPVTKGSPSTPSRIFGSTGTGLGANLYEIDPNTGARTLIGVTGMNHLGSLAYDPNTDTLYGVGNNSSNVSVLVTLDLTTGAATTIGAVGYSAGSGGLAFDPNTNTLYHISLITLRKINTATGAATIVGSGSISNMDGLAFDPNTNTLYASNSGTNSLYRINTSNGQPTLIGAYGVDVALTGLDFDSSTNTIYLSDFQTDRLYTVAPNTGAATPVGPAVTGFDIQGLAVIPGTPGTSLISTTPHIEVTSHGGGVTIEDGGQLLGGIGNVDLDATGDIALTGISTTGHVTARSTAGAILDGGDTRSDVDAATFTAEAVNGVGIDANALDTRIGNFEATGGTGGVFLG
ncbi:MAG: S8 family serine peptidase, partial [Verrucomicrobiae bacterium]|nr:S8 family serine peptidase [Verrucomicrobiae bacterium]